jgi:transposase
MKIDNIEVEQTLAQVKKQIEEEKNLSPTLRASLELLLTLVRLLLNRLGRNSRNSSKPPSSDPNRKKTRINGNNHPGAQQGHTGNHLELVDDPDQVELLEVERATLPPDGNFQCIGFERRQVFDIRISRVVTEYQAEILEDERGRRVVAPFPEQVKVKTQYACGVKIHSVYMSNFQLLPYKRIEEHFADQFNIPLRAGSIYNFNKEAYERLDPFEPWVKQAFAKECLLHADETGINIGGKRNWLHVLCSTTLTWLMPMISAAVRPWRRWVSCPSIPAPWYTTIGSPTTSSLVITRCAMPTTCVNSNVPGNRINSSGPNTRRRSWWRSTRPLMRQAVCSTPRKPKPSGSAIDNS